mgnify:CR=1 FL=1
MDEFVVREGHAAYRLGQIPRMWGLREIFAFFSWLFRAVFKWFI